MRKVLDRLPALKNTIGSQGHFSVTEYSEKMRNFHPRAGKDRTDELLFEVKKKMSSLFGDKLAGEAIKELEEQYYVSTGDHHGPLTHPFSLNGTFAEALVNRKSGKKFIFTFSCSGISLNNSSFPRGLIFHGPDCDEKRLHFFSLKQKHQPIYSMPKYGLDLKEKLENEIAGLELGAYAGELKSIMNRTFLKREVLEAGTFSDQISVGNRLLWKLLPGEAGRELIYLDSENLVRNILIDHHINKLSPINLLLFDKKVTESFYRNFDGVTGAFDTKEGKGTFLFWAIVNGKRHQLKYHKDSLVNQEQGLVFDLKSEVIGKALQNGTLMPGLALTYIILSFYYGLTIGGGFSQVNYLGDMKFAWIKLLNDVGLEKDSFLDDLVTDFYARDYALINISDRSRTEQATLLDVLLYGDREIDGKLKKLFEGTNLRTAAAAMIPEMHKIIFGEKIAKKNIIKPVLILPSNFRTPFTPKSCLYCGNNPVPHRLQWLSESSLLMMNPMNRVMARAGIFRGFSKMLDRLFMVWWKIFAKFGLVGFHEDRKSWTIARANVLWEEADRRGIKMRGARIFGRDVDFYEAEVGNRKIYFSGLPRPDENKDTEIEFWIDDKAALKDVLRRAGVPVSPGGAFSSYRKLLQEFRKLEKPVIIKPRLGSRGRHTTTHIYTEDQLLKAFKIAKQLCHWVVMEEHLTGDVYRGTVIGGKLAGVLGGSPPRITGDGIHTIDELIDIKNQNKDPRVKDVRLNAFNEEFLRRNGLGRTSVLPLGKTIDLTEKIGVSYGGTSYEITEETHEEIKEALEAAAAAIGDPLLGFDFIIDDVRVSPGGKKWGIIECNGLPFINLHHDPLLGKPNNVAKFVWDLHLKN